MQLAAWSAVEQQGHYEPVLGIVYLDILNGSSALLGQCATISQVLAAWHKTRQMFVYAHHVRTSHETIGHNLQTNSASAIFAYIPAPFHLPSVSQPPPMCCDAERQTAGNAALLGRVVPLAGGHAREALQLDSNTRRDLLLTTCCKKLCRSAAYRLPDRPTCM